MSDIDASCRNATNPSSQPAIRFTVFTNLDGRLSKKITLENGQFIKSGTTQLKFGNFTTELLPFNGDAWEALRILALTIDGMEPDRAIALGHYHDDAVTSGIIKSEENLAAADAVAADLGIPRISAGAVTRSKKNFIAETSCGLLLIDNDDPNANPHMVRNQLVQLWPLFEDVAMLIRPSASDGIRDVDSNNCMRGGAHVYVVISDAGRAKEVLEALDLLCWLRSYGRIELARNGDALERSLVDTAVWSPERLIYEGRTVLGRGLVQQTRQSFIHGGLGGVLDVDRFLEFVDPLAIAAEVAALKAKARSDPGFLERQRERRAAWETKHAARLEARGIDPQTARQAAMLLRAGNGVKGTLAASDVFAAKDGREIPISEILLDPTAFDGITGPDPIEGPEYGRTTARVMAKDGRLPTIFSYAHGAGTYLLMWDPISLAHALVDGRFGTCNAFIAALANATITPTDEAKLAGAAAVVFASTAATIEEAVAKARERPANGPPLSPGQETLYQACRTIFDREHQLKGRLGAIAAVEAMLAAVVGADAEIVLPRVIFLLASRDAASGPRRAALEHLIATVMGAAGAIRMIPLIDKAVAKVATDLARHGRRAASDLTRRGIYR